MAFSGLTERLQNAFSRLRKKGKVTEVDIKESMREVRVALLEADVNFKVVKEFVAKVSERAVGQEILESLTPGQQIIKIVNDELTQLMGGSQSKLNEPTKPPMIIMMVGLQGAGKSTTAAKLARLLKSQNKKPMLIAADVYRPAAIQQLQQLGEQIDLPVFALLDNQNPVNIVKQALDSIEKGKHSDCDTIIIDTAGRLHIDEELMKELQEIKNVSTPDEILLVVDAMTGQDAVNVASNFNQLVGLTGVILTKLDGDARGGAALSIRSVTQCPIKFIGTGEKIDKLEPFYPERMSSRILGMGDMLSLIERAEAVVDANKAKELEKKLKTNTFDLNDFLEQMRQMRKMGSIDDLLSAMPGLSQKLGKNKPDIDDKRLDYAEAIICSMTQLEKEKPEIINASRRKRISRGSGTTVSEVNKLLKQFEDARSMMKKLSGMMGSGKQKKKRRFGLPFFGR